MLLVGALVLAASALVLARRDGSAALLRLGYRSLLIGALPAWIVMRGAAEWIADKEGLTGDEVPSWVDIGYSIADPGLLAAPDLDRARRPRPAPRRPRGESGRRRPQPGLDRRSFRCSWSPIWWRSGR